MNSSVSGFLCFGFLVFGGAGHPAAEYLKFQLVYGPILLANLLVLPLAIEYSPLSPYLIQGLFVPFAIIAGYLGKKFFTFRRLRSRR